jgi:hypothetical protein
MRIGGLLLCAALLACGATSAAATMRISDDRGGQIGTYLEAFAAVRATGEPVIVDGNCLSACTLLLGLIPRGQICATSRARFGFHAAWMPDLVGRPVPVRWERRRCGKSIRLRCGAGSAGTAVYRAG